jgi:hypothetical protein
MTGGSAKPNAMDPSSEAEANSLTENRRREDLMATTPPGLR